MSQNRHTIPVAGHRLAIWALLINSLLLAVVSGVEISQRLAEIRQMKSRLIPSDQAILFPNAFWPVYATASLIGCIVAIRLLYIIYRGKEPNETSPTGK